MTWHDIFCFWFWSDLIWYIDMTILYSIISILIPSPLSLVLCQPLPLSLGLHPPRSDGSSLEFFSPPGADRFLIAHGMEKFTEASTFQVGRSKGWYVPQPSHPIEYPGYNHSHIYLGLHPDIECLSGTVTGDTSSGWQVFSRFSLWFSHVSITCLGASESGTAVFGLCSLASLESINHYKDA